MRSRLLLLVLLSAAVAKPEMVRPVAGIHFTGNVTPGLAAGASDGHDFLLVWQPTSFVQGWSEPRKGGVYGQRVVGGKVQPAFQIDPISYFLNVAVVWTGSHYLVGSPHADGIFINVVSAEGHVIGRSSHPVLPDAITQFRMTANRREVLLTALSNQQDGLVGIVLDADGNPAGPERKLYSRTLTYGVAAAGDGYAIAVGDWRTTTVLRIASDGRLFDRNGTLIEGPYPSDAAGYHSSWMAVSSDGTNIVVAFVGSQWRKASVLKTAVLGLDGSIVKPLSTVFTMPVHSSEQGLTIPRLIWAGSGYLALLGISDDPPGDVHVRDPAFLRITSDGQAVGQPNFLVRGSARQEPGDVVASSTGHLITWLSNTNQEIFGSFFAILPRESTGPVEHPQPIGRSMSAQRVRGVGNRGTDRLIAWSEEGQPGVNLEVIGASGAILETASIPLIPGSAQLAIASDGANWLIAWATWDVSVLPLDARLQPIMQKPLSFGDGDSVSASWNGKSYVIVFTPDGGISATTLSADGRQGAVQRILDRTYDGKYSSISYSSPTIASLEDGSFAAFSVTLTSYPPFGGFFTTSWAAALRLDSNGVPTSPLIQFVGAVGVPSVATDGERYAVVWSDTQVRAMILNRYGVEQSRLVLDLSGSNPQVVWDGFDFLAVWNDPHSVHIARISPAMLLYWKSSIRFSDDESVFDVRATGGTGPTVIGMTQRSSRFDDLWRAGFLFAGDFQEPPVRPDPPVITSTSVIGGAVDIVWRRQTNVYGYAVEEVGHDGLTRLIEILSPADSFAHVSLDTFEPASIQLRSWNTAGFSEPSQRIPIAPMKTRAVRRR